MFASNPQRSEPERFTDGGSPLWDLNDFAWVNEFATVVQPTFDPQPLGNVLGDRSSAVGIAFFTGPGFADTIGFVE